MPQVIICNYGLPGWLTTQYPWQNIPLEAGWIADPLGVQAMRDGVFVTIEIGVIRQWWAGEVIAYLPTWARPRYRMLFSIPWREGGTWNGTSCATIRISNEIKLLSDIDGKVFGTIVCRGEDL